MKKSIFVTSLVASFHFGSLHAQTSVCEAVYKESVRNVDIQSRVLTEQNDTFSTHCEVNGSLKSSSTNVDLSIPVKAIKIGFSGSKNEAQQEMQEFCKTFTQRLNRFDSFYQLNNHVVVDALTSFNQCVALEKESVRISHAATESRSLVVRVGFNPTEANVSLRSVDYDSSAAQCSTSITEGGKSIELSRDMKEVKAMGPFSISCTRTAQPTSTGDLKFSRLELLVDTNRGAYKVTMPTEEMLGYDLASQNKMNLLAAMQEHVRLRNQIDLLQAKMAGVRASAHFSLQGEKAKIKCPRDGGNPQAYAKNICGSASVVGLVGDPSREGGSCGYKTWRWTCVSFP